MAACRFAKFVTTHFRDSAAGVVSAAFRPGGTTPPGCASPVPAVHRPAYGAGLAQACTTPTSAKPWRSSSSLSRDRRSVQAISSTGGSAPSFPCLPASRKSSTARLHKWFSRRPILGSSRISMYNFIQNRVDTGKKSDSRIVKLSYRSYQADGAELIRYCHFVVQAPPIFTNPFFAPGSED